MTTIHHDLIVITGGPGAGKTTLIDMLRDNGLTTTPEAGRAIIQDQGAIGGAGLPWDDTALFAELMLSWDIRSYRWALSQTGRSMKPREPTTPWPRPTPTTAMT